MKASIYAQTKKHVAKALGVENFAEAVTASNERHESFIREAKKRQNVKCRGLIKDLSSDNPYSMLGRKVNTEGKYV